MSSVEDLLAAAEIQVSSRLRMVPSYLCISK